MHSNYSAAVDLVIQSEVQGHPHHEFILQLGETPQLLIEKAGFPNLPMAISTKVISKSCFDHGIGTKLIKRIPYIINRPDCIFKSANLNLSDSVVLLTFEFHNGYPIIIPVRKNRQVGRQNNRYNMVTSIYGKEGPDPKKKWIREGLLIWKS